MINGSTRKGKGTVGYPAGTVGVNRKVKDAPSNAKGSSIGGLKARSNGRQFEHVIDVTCQMYQKKGVGMIQKTPEPMRVLKNQNNGQFTCVFEKKAQPDYTGVLKRGKSIMFEAKHTDGKLFPFNRINDEQWKTLKTHHALGGQTYVVLSFNQWGYYSVPFGDWIQIVSTIKKKSVNVGDLAAYRVPYTHGFVDFLRVL